MSEPGEHISSYARWLLADNDQCIPVINAEDLNIIYQRAIFGAYQIVGTGPIPLVYYDLEHLQIVDYSKLEGASDAQRTFIGKLNREEPIAPEEMLYLALRSLFQFAFPQPNDENDLRFAAACDLVLNKILTETALDLGKRLVGSGNLLPYWGRLSFLRVMQNLPTENVARFGLDRVVCTLVKRSKFNATTFVFDGNPVIGLNYALEPILKHLNRFLLHYFCTRDMAGPKRSSRAWEGIAPTILHFWSDVVATALTRSTVTLFDEEMAVMAHRLTSSQLDFIVMHELGHVAFDHPRRLQEAIADGLGVKALRHEFEFAADIFALGLSRSHLVRELRMDVEETKEGASTSERVRASLHDYQRDIGAVYLLFEYMDFVQKAGELLRDRLSGDIRIRNQMDSHPSASARLAHLELMNVGEFLYTGKLYRYARDFFAETLEYASSLDDQHLLASLKV